MRWAGDDPALRTAGGGGARQARCGRARRPRASRPSAIARKVREAAELLVLGDDHALAGEALEAIGDHLAAANAYSAGGLVERMEAALAKDDDAHGTRARGGRRVRRLPDARCGSAGATMRAPSSCARSPRRAVAGEYRRLLDQLDTALLTAGKVELRRRGKPLIVACAAPKIVLGRDPLCDLTLRAGGVSRQHAEIERDRATAFLLRDLDSRNGTSRRAACRSPGASRSSAPAGSGSATSARSTSSSRTDALILRVRERARSRRRADRRRRRPAARARAARARRSTSCSSAAGRCSGAARCTRRQVQRRAARRRARAADPRRSHRRRRRRDRRRLMASLVAAAVRRKEPTPPRDPAAPAPEPQHLGSEDEVFLAQLVARSRATASAATRSAAPTCSQRIDGRVEVGPRAARDRVDGEAAQRPRGPAGARPRRCARRSSSATSSAASSTPRCRTSSSSSTEEPHALRAHYLLAEHARKRGDHERALRHYEAVLGRDVDYPNVRVRVERLRAADRPRGAGRRRDDRRRRRRRRPGRRALSAGARARARRDRRRLPRARRRARSRRRGQAPAPAPRRHRARRRARAVLPRGARDGVAAPPERRRGARHGRGLAPDRDGARRRRHAARRAARARRRARCAARSSATARSCRRSPPRTAAASSTAISSRRT